MGDVSRRIRWLQLPTSVYAVDTLMSLKARGLELHVKHADSEFSLSHVDRATKPWMLSDVLLKDLDVFAFIDALVAFHSRTHAV